MPSVHAKLYLGIFTLVNIVIIIILILFCHQSENPLLPSISYLIHTGFFLVFSKILYHLCDFPVKPLNKLHNTLLSN